MATCARCGEPHADLALCGPCDAPFCPGCRVEVPPIDTYCADCFARLRYEFLHDYYGEGITPEQVMAGMIADGEVKALVADGRAPMDDHGDRLAELADQAEALAFRIFLLWRAEWAGTPRHDRLLALSHRAEARTTRRMDAIAAYNLAHSPP